MSTFDYDVIVIGAGISGLTTAALLIKQGFKVIILEEDSLPGGLCKSISKDGYGCEKGVSLLWGAKDGGAFNFLLRKLGLYNVAIDNSLIKKLDPAFQVVLPNHRINIYSKRKLLFEELNREFPQSIDKIKDFYEKVDSKVEDTLNSEVTIDPYSFERGQQYLPPWSNSAFNAKSNARSFAFDKELERFFDIQTMFFGHEHFLSSSPLFSSLMLGLSKRGVYSFTGGTQKIIDMLVSYIKKNGGHILLNARVDNIIVKNNTAKGVRVHYEGIVQEISGRCLVSSVNIFSQEALIEDKSGKKIYNKFLKKRNKKCIPFTLCLGVDEKVIPDPMREHLFIMRDYNLLPGSDNYIYLSLSPAGDTKRAPKGKRILTVSIFVDEGDFINKTGDEIKRKGDELIKYVEQVIPFLPQYIDMIFPVDLKINQNQAKGDMKKKIVGQGKKGFKSDFSSLTHRLPIKRFLQVGDSTYPGNGIVCAVRSALDAVNLICQL